MRIGLTIYAYSPHGGLERDARRIAEALARRGHGLTVLTTRWQGEPVEGATHETIAVRGQAQRGQTQRGQTQRGQTQRGQTQRGQTQRGQAQRGQSNHARMRRYAKGVRALAGRFEVLVGFQSCPGLDVRFVGDASWADRIGRFSPRRLMPRYRTYLSLEREAFTEPIPKRLLFLTERGRCAYQNHYRFPDDRAVVLPPSIDPRFGPDTDRSALRAAFRTRHGITDRTAAFLFVASSFHTKGLDRALAGLAAFRHDHVALHVVGDDRAARYRRLAERLGLGGKIVFHGATGDVRPFYAGCDALLHPARQEAAGKVLLEAALSGLWVITTDVAGYAVHLQGLNAAHILPAAGLKPSAITQAIAKVIGARPVVPASRIASYLQSNDLRGGIERAIEAIEAAAIEAAAIE